MYNEFEICPFFIDNFINSTSHCTTGDAKLIPVIIPNKEQLKVFEEIFENALKIKKIKIQKRILMLLKNTT